MPKPDEEERISREIGARVRGARTAKGWSQEKLAESLGLDAVTVSRMETGRRSIAAATAVQIASSLGVSVSTLLAQVEPEAMPALDEGTQLLRAMDGRRREVAVRILRELARI